MTTASFQLRRRMLAAAVALAALSGSVVAAEAGHGAPLHPAGKPGLNKKCPGGRFNPDGTCAGPIHQ